MTKKGRTRFMIESMILNTKDLEEKHYYIKLYNDKLKRLGINEVYETIPFEET